MKKRILAAVLMSCALVAPGAAEAAAKPESDRIGIVLNGSKAAYEASYQPFIQADRVQVPVRYLFESFGAEVRYDASTGTVYADAGDMTLTVKTGSTSMTVDGRSVKLDSPATIRGGRMFVPIRAIGEALGANVGWNANTREVRVGSPIVRGSAVSPESLDADTAARARAMSAYETAVVALTAYYKGQTPSGFAVSPELAANWQAEQTYEKVWAQYGSVKEEQGRHVVELLMIGQDRNGALRTIGADVAEVTPMAESAGYALTGLGHLELPAPTGAASVWIGRGADSSIAPQNVTADMPAPIEQDGTLLLPAELLNRFGTVAVRSDGTYTLTLRDGSAKTLPASRSGGKAYISIEALTEAFDGLTIRDLQETIEYQVDWNEAARQVLIQIESNHPVG
ncbi:copper amine oxidase N-terminal domain-containing protein [Paenibacillus sp.]|uniref:copper amine oxidase N-terminal domain-containing protein n=1 Tax=Paenibacillus sp. TaxID=58172 RepID=UPI002D3A7610|nr:copper amine oxidase N-terminal domain-containing protein [Paenibacillus sp.]HZG88533.1 copper amine oxidase N-terminal domain-containing protein [Paenibacillus sp.]